jgi:hypothetical protein
VADLVSASPRSVWSRRAARLLAVVLGVVTLGIGMAEVPLDSLTHQAGTAGRWPTR